MARGRKSEGGNVPRIGIHGLNDDDGLWYPFSVNSSGLLVLEQPVQVSGDEGILNQDEVDHSLIGIDLTHHKIHEGAMYEVYYYDDDLADDGTIIISTPNPIGAEVHFSFSGTCGGDATIELIEGATPTGGAAMIARNMNRNYGDSALAPLLNPALAGGIILTEIFLPGGVKNQATGASGTSRGDEWVTIASEIYAVRLTNIAGSAKPAALHVNFYTP